MTGARGFARRLNASLRGRLLMWLLAAAFVVGLVRARGPDLGGGRGEAD